MPREIKMPKLSDTMEEGTINVWRKNEGDRVEKGEILVEIETDKADMEYEAYTRGKLERILVPAGETVDVGVPIAVVRLDSDSDADVAAVLEKHGAKGGAPAEAPAHEAPAEEPAGQAAPERKPPAQPAKQESERPSREARPEPEPTPSIFSKGGLPEPTTNLPFFLPDPDRVRATPRARVLAQERGADLSEIAGSGPEGAVLVADVERYLEALEAEREPLLEGDVPVTPVAQRIAEELHVDLSTVKGTGLGGRVTKRDLRAHLEAQQREGKAGELFGDEVKLSQKRKFLIRNMVESKKSAPHFYISMEVDAGPLAALRARLKQESKHITYTHLLLKASALALERFPEANATFREDRILRFNPINVALAVDVQDELVAPVLRDCQGRTLEDLARDADALIAKARERKLAPGDYADGTFTISNLGMFGVTSFYAIITPPQSMVLSVGSLRREPVVDGDSVRVGSRMSLGLACDHRVLDGVRAAQFLAELKRLLESPEELLQTSGAQH